MAHTSGSTSKPVAECRACQHPRPVSGGDRYGEGHGDGDGDGDGTNGFNTAWAVTSLRSMDNSAKETGCATCSLLADGFRATIGPNSGLVASPGSDGRLGDVNNTETDERQLRIDFNGAATTPSLDLFDFATSTAVTVFCTTKTPWITKTLPDLPLGRYTIPSSTASEESCAWAQRKLRQCLSAHNSCPEARPQSGDSWPSRLVYIGSATQNIVRLDDVNDATPPYLCLSHCWGRGISLRTLSSNIEQLRKTIAWDALPLTFQEAMDFTRRLGYRYLWIDSICIIQDDEDDWRRESGKMAAIYESADLVLSASGASDGGAGLYSAMDQSSETDFSTHTVDLKNRDGSVESIAFRRGLAHLPNITERRLKSAPEFPTLRRGWIFQERVLSTRVLHFGPHELAWECLCETICQCRDELDGGSGDAAHNDVVRRASRNKASYTLPHWQTLSHHDLSRCWHQLVEDYTALNLTFEKDIFPAISGIVKRFQAAQLSAYIAGLWETSLLSDMLWAPNPASGTTSTQSSWPHRPSPWRAPSWSWASVKTPVEYINTHKGVDFFCSVVNTRVRLAGSDSTGEILDASLVLKGHLLSAMIHYRELPPSQKRHPWNLLALDILQNHVNNTWIDYDCSLTGVDYMPESAEVNVFIVGESIPSGALLALVLKSLPNKGQATYERLGIVQISKAPQFSGGMVKWLELLGSTGTATTVELL